MNIYNLLYSGFEFSEDEDLLKYKFRILNTVAIIIAIFSTFFGVLSDLGVNDVGEIHSKVDYLLVYVSYMLNDRKSGAFYTILSILAILISNYFIDLGLSDNAINSGILGLIIVSLLSRAYNIKITSFEKSLHLKNQDLHLLAST